MSIVLWHSIQVDVQWIIANARIATSGVGFEPTGLERSGHVMRKTTRISETPGLNRRRFCGAAVLRRQPWLRVR
jgi:hypothetical protein